MALSSPYECAGSHVFYPVAVPSASAGGAEKRNRMHSLSLMLTQMQMHSQVPYDWRIVHGPKNDGMEGKTGRRMGMGLHSGTWIGIRNGPLKFMIMPMSPV